MNLFSTEFQSFSENYYKSALEAGLVKVNNEIVGPDYVLKNNDLLTNTTHKHIFYLLKKVKLIILNEPPVLYQPIEISYDCDDFIIANKPSSIPVHPCGAYQYNTLIYILAKEYGYKNLKTVHRLDRLTSGLVLLAKNKETAKEMADLIQDCKVHKTYLARVDGKFPQSEKEWLELYKNSDIEDKKNFIEWKDDEVTVTIPTQPFSIKEAIYECNEDGKETITKFQFKNYNGKTSIVVCKPITGKTHQIRLHLQYIGFPIANDPHYNNRIKEKIVVKKHKPFELEDLNELFKKDTKDWSKLCPFCNMKSRGDDDINEAFSDIQLSWKCIWLHALQYEYKDHWCYSVSEPIWAKEDYDI